MTRFARAKGSKSSNEKKPEDATSWSEMKNSMLSRKISELDKSLPKMELKTDTEKPTEWASLGDNFGNSESLIKQHLNKTKNKINDIDPGNSREVMNKKKKMKKQKLKPTKNLERGIKQDGANRDLVIKDISKGLNFSISEELNPDINESGMKNENKKRKFQAGLNSKSLLPMKKKKISKDNQILEVNVEKQPSENLTNKSSKPFQKMKKTMKSKYLKNEGVNKNFKSKFSGKKMNNQLKDRKKSRNRSYEEINSGVEELIINGEKIPIVKFQGFNVTLEDAERLKKLRNEMVKEGIPKAKLETAIKLERRRAEKALSRLKKSVCFHCRGHGHLLSNCPDLTEKENTSTGICYKCGSTEHSAFECKVVRGTNFQFAECFICKEQGHIARQCPDNPRGLYPQGGACRECGDVTHLRRDCPQIQTQKAEEIVTVGLRNDRNLECLDEEILNKKPNPKKKTKKSSTVKF